MSFWIIQNSSLFSAVSEKISAGTALFQRWFLALKISVFSAVQSWIGAVQRFSGNQQRWNRPESILNQSWSALNVSETSTRESMDLWWGFQRQGFIIQRIYIFQAWFLCLSYYKSIILDEIFYYTWFHFRVKLLAEWH